MFSLCRAGLRPFGKMHIKYTPVILREVENCSVLCAALDQLPPIQARRVYAHYILGKKKSEIARAENVEGSAVCDSIRRGLKNLSEILKNFH